MVNTILLASRSGQKDAHNKGMQSDQTTRYARGLTADAGRYSTLVSSNGLFSPF